MICPECDGDGFFEIDESYMSYGVFHGKWSMEKYKDCDGTGKVDDVADKDILNINSEDE